jgi:hypothetical protein
MGRIRKKTRQSNWLSAPPPVIRCPFHAIDPFPTVSPTSGMLVCLWYHRGGAAWLSFRPLIFLRGENKNNMQQSNGFRCQPPVLRRPFQRIRPLPHSMDIGYARLFMISTGRRGKTQFSSTNICKRRKKNTQQSESEKHSTIKLLIGVHGGFLTRMMNVTK